MANYTSHAIMSELLYDKVNNSFKTYINKDSMKLFSLGQDLTYFNMHCFNDSHSINSKKFFINTISYILNNDLKYDSDVMAYLYGHIAHYCLDIYIHPFIKNIVNDVSKEGYINPHTIVECDMDRYLINKYGNNNYYLNNKSINKVKGLINSTYRNVYGYFNISNSYINTIKLIKSINKLLLFSYRNINIFNLGARRDKYINNINFYYYINNDSYLYNMFDSIVSNSINEAIKIIKYVNKYLYNKQEINYLNLVFNDSPYDIGLVNDIKYGLNKIPIYSRIKIK